MPQAAPVLHQERDPPLTALRAERDPLTEALLLEAPPPTGPPWPTPTIAPRWERDPLTLALLTEAYPKASAEWLHRDLGRAPPPGTKPMPSTSSGRPPPHSTAARRGRAIDRSRTWATTDKPISPEAKAAADIILSVLADRRRRASWEGEKAFDGWHQEAQDIIAQVIPDRRSLLDAYAAFRSLVRRKRRTWTLAEDITDLDDALDKMEVPRV